jgi:hypothetical protein
MRHPHPIGVALDLAGESSNLRGPIPLFITRKYHAAITRTDAFIAGRII